MQPCPGRVWQSLSIRCPRQVTLACCLGYLGHARAAGAHRLVQQHDRLVQQHRLDKCSTTKGVCIWRLSAALRTVSLAILRHGAFPPPRMHDTVGHEIRSHDPLRRRTRSHLGAEQHDAPLSLWSSSIASTPAVLEPWDGRQAGSPPRPSFSSEASCCRVRKRGG